MAFSGPIAHHPAPAGSAPPRANERHRPSSGGLPINTTLARLVCGIAVTVLIGCGTPIPASIINVTIDGGDRTLELGATLTLTATVTTTGNANDTLTWTSSNTNIATIDQTGTVTSLTTGSTIITATSVTDPTKSDTITLTVDSTVWTREFAEGTISGGSSMAIDADGNVYVAGTIATDIGNNAVVLNGYLARYSPKGDQAWLRTTQTGGTGSGVAVDQNGFVYTVGYSGFTLSVAKYTNTGDMLWSESLASARGTGIALDDDGGVYVAGHTFVGGNSTTENTYFVAKFDALLGALQWKRDFEIGEARAAVVHEGALFVVGQIVVPTATSSERYVFLAKHGLISGDQLLTPTTFQGVSIDRGTVNMAHAITARPDGTLLIAGQTNGSLVAGQNKGRMDAFVAFFDAVTMTPSLLFQFGTAEFDRANGVAWDADGNAIVVGETFGDLSGSNAGESDAFIARFDRFGTFKGYQQTGTAAYDRAQGVAVHVNGDFFVTGQSRTTSSFLSKGWLQIAP